MSTRSRIGVVNSDGTVDSVYCHYDGHLRHVGQTLVDHYTDDSKLHQLIALGDLKSLGRELGQKHCYYITTDEVCTFFGRDGNYLYTESVHHDDVEDFMLLSEEYNYLFFYGRWMVYQEEASGWRQVTESMTKVDLMLADAQACRNEIPA